MEIIFTIFFVFLFIFAIILSYSSIRYFITMWKFKNRKKNAKKDDDFKYFD